MRRFFVGFFFWLLAGKWYGIIFTVVVLGAAFLMGD